MRGRLSLLSGFTICVYIEARKAKVKWQFTMLQFRFAPACRFMKAIRPSRSKPRHRWLMAIQRTFPVFFRGELIGSLVPNLIVDDAVIVDPKVVACFTDTRHLPNDWVSKHHGARPRASHKFQKRSIGMETRSTHAGAPGSRRT